MVAIFPSPVSCITAAVLRPRAAPSAATLPSLDRRPDPFTLTKGYGKNDRGGGPDIRGVPRTQVHGPPDVSLRPSSQPRTPATKYLQGLPLSQADRSSSTGPDKYVLL
ncbi:Hypp1902 [Branchiostoma lanceolatum]|uniref:Hypp1902 protein n=1 Tax=Branchiostoma lanceolatum TaxID=7740 RepID=A0A8J9ZPM4_BRALA|nr:Hypp1902 [Branchiostoma lanceolatum]